jgi:hypothetical protein
MNQDNQVIVKFSPSRFVFFSCGDGVLVQKACLVSLDDGKIVQKNFYFDE